MSELIKTQCSHNADAGAADAQQCFEVQWSGERILHFILSVRPLTADMIDAHYENLSGCSIYRKRQGHEIYIKDIQTRMGVVTEKGAD